MKKLLFLLALLPLLATGQTYYPLVSYDSAFRIGPVLYPLNSVILVQSRDTNYVGFNYAAIPSSINPVYFNNTIIAPKYYRYYLLGTDTATSATAVINWYTANAVSSAGGGVYMTVGNPVANSTTNRALYIDGSGNLAQTDYVNAADSNVDGGYVAYYTLVASLAGVVFKSDSNDVFATQYGVDTVKQAIRAEIPGVTVGTYSTTGIALQTDFVIAHGLAYTPAHVSIEPTSVGSMGVHYTEWDATNITVHFAVAPGVVTVSLSYLTVK